MKKLRLFGFVVFILLILFLLAKFYLPHFLSYKKPVDSNNFLIEAWISSWEIEQAVREYGHDPDSRFYIVGYMYPELVPKRLELNQSGAELDNNNNNGIWLYANSSLGFSIPGNLSSISGDTVKIIVTARGQEAANRFAYFNVVINGECIGGAFSENEYQDYSFDWIVSDEGLKTFNIKFNNDLVINNTDRNLNIKSVLIGNHLLTANKNCTTLLRDLNNLTSGFATQAEEMQDYLLQLGIDENQITIINFERVKRNQTLAAAEKFHDFIASVSLPSINVITTDIHSRRTWFTYHRIIGKQTRVGVLCYPAIDPGKIKTSYTDLFYVIDEFLSYFANWVQLTF